MDGAPGAETDLGWALGAISRSYLRAVRDAVSDVPGGVRGYLVLAVAGRGEPKSQLALAQHLGVDRTAMTYLLDDLENVGLVERRPDPADRRARRVTLTEPGRALMEELKTGLRHIEDRLLAPLSGDERAVLRGLLQRLATSVAPASPCEALPCDMGEGLVETARLGPHARRRSGPAARAGRRHTRA